MFTEKEIIILIFSFNAILLLIGGIIFAIACLSQRELLIWMPVFIILTIGSILLIFDYRMIGNIIFLVAAIFNFSAAFIEYYRLFIKTANQKSQAIKSIEMVLAVSPIIIGLQLLIIGLLMATIMMLMRIYFRTKSITRMFFIVSMVGATFAMSFNLLNSYEIEGAAIISNIIVASYTSILAVSGIVAMLEQKINNTINEKAILKDKYSHDLGNILHSMSMTYDLIINKDISQGELNEVHNLLQTKIFEASDLVKEIRKL